MKIAFGADHAGYEGDTPYKPALVEHIEALGHTVVDRGTNGPGSADYPVYAHAVAEAVAKGEADRGILLCGTGVGMAMAANKHAGVRAATCTSPEMAKLSREHNDANVLSLGSRLNSLDECMAIVDAWLATPFTGEERHRRRIAQIG